MPNYQIATILSPNADSKKIEAVELSLKQFLAQHKGNLIEATIPRRIELAYEILGNRSGYFQVFTIESNPASLEALNKELKLKETVLRFTLFKQKPKSFQVRPKSPRKRAARPPKKASPGTKQVTVKEKKVKLEEIDKKLDNLLEKSM